MVHAVSDNRRYTSKLPVISAKPGLRSAARELTAMDSVAKVSTYAV